MPELARCAGSLGQSGGIPGVAVRENASNRGLGAEVSDLWNAGFSVLLWDGAFVFDADYTNVVFNGRVERMGAGRHPRPERWAVRDLRRTAVSGHVARLRQRGRGEPVGRGVPRSNLGQRTAVPGAGGGVLHRRTGTGAWRRDHLARRERPARRRRRRLAEPGRVPGTLDRLQHALSLRCLRCPAVRSRQRLRQLRVPRVSDADPRDEPATVRDRQRSPVRRSSVSTASATATAPPSGAPTTRCSRRCRRRRSGV